MIRAVLHLGSHPGEDSAQCAVTASALTPACRLAAKPLFPHFPCASFRLSASRCRGAGAGMRARFPFHLPVAPRANVLAQGLAPLSIPVGEHFFLHNILTGTAPGRAATQPRARAGRAPACPWAWLAWVGN